MPPPQRLHEQQDPPTVSSEKLRHISNEELVRRCIANERSAWEKFFRRFIPKIKKTIRKVFYAKSRFDLVGDMDVIGEIHNRVVVKLYVKGGLKSCRNHSNVESWLVTLVKNQTLDWLIEQGRIKRLPKTESERNTASLSTPLNPDSEEGLRLEDIIGDQATLDGLENLDEFKREIEEALEALRSLDKDRKLWALRLSLISHVPLSDKEIEELARFANHPVQKVRKRLKEIIARLEAMEKKRAADTGRAIVIWHEIRRLEAQLLEKSRSSLASAQDELEKLSSKLEAKRRIYEELLSKRKAFVRPSNSEIAELIGMDEEKAAQVSNLLFRARAFMEKRRNRGFGGSD
ncbi:MAG: hypothetical protein DRH12_11995 [Deltaproteobacteria bacterium]|nr:MAG: hypothetical protein DRH12_11995 [Deltaproteobacteria bacterium]